MKNWIFQSIFVFFVFFFYKSKFVLCGTWKWVDGHKDQGLVGQYGNYREFDPTNETPRIMGGYSWVVKKNGHSLIYLFGGFGIDQEQKKGTYVLSDTFLYNHTLGQWSWIHGTGLANEINYYGTEDEYSEVGFPGNRHNGASHGTVPYTNELILFGGKSYGGSKFEGVWYFHPDLMLWKFVKGSRTASFAADFSGNGNYHIDCTPGSSVDVASAMHGDEFLVFGGGWNSYSNDIFAFNSTLKQWRWLNAFHAGNIAKFVGKGIVGGWPGARYGATACVVGNYFYIYGGYGFGTSGTGNEGDLWKFDVLMRNWTWVGGRKNLNDLSEVAGSLGIYDSTYMPSNTRYPEMRAFGSFITFFGGSVPNYKNNVWMFDTSTNEFALVAGEIHSENIWGVYDVAGAFSTTGKPGGRSKFIMEVIDDNTFIILGGKGLDDVGLEYVMNDEWHFDTSKGSTGQWMYVRGFKTYNILGVYPPDVNQNPGRREGMYKCKISDSNWILFGGNGYDSTGSGGDLNDVWTLEIDDGNMNWERIKGNSIATQASIKGNPFEFNDLNTPSSRRWGVCLPYVVQNQLVFLMGEQYHTWELSEFWIYDIPTNEFAFVTGEVDQQGVYGPKGVPSHDYIFGARSRALAFLFNDHELFIYGGYGKAVVALDGDLNDVWKVDLNCFNFTWVSGNSNINYFPNYPNGNVLNVYNESHNPGGRNRYVGWKHSDSFCIYGGYPDNNFFLGMWCFDININMWAMIWKSPHVDQLSHFIDIGEYDPTNAPGDESGGVLFNFIDEADIFFYLIGYGSSYSGNTNYYHELWKFKLSTNEWAIESIGNVTFNGRGIFGTKGKYDIANHPSGRVYTQSFKYNKEMVIYGGYGYDIYNHDDILDDVWMYVASVTCFEFPDYYETVCSSHGTCIFNDICSCDNGYYGKNCNVHECYGILSNETGVCNNGGDCIDIDTCSCYISERHGNACEFTYCFNVSSTSFNACNFGNCITFNECECAFFSNGNTCNEIRIEYVIAMIVVSSIVVVLLIIFIIVLIITGIIVICRSRINSAYKRIKAIGQLKDVELLLEEQKAQKQNESDPKLRIKSSMFLIDIKKVKLIKQIGKGGSDSIIYMAKWEGKDVALKQYRTGIIQTNMNVEEFEREVEILASLAHPSILKFYGASIHLPHVAFIMELCSNGDVENYILNHKGKKTDLTNTNRIRILYEIALGMKFLHSKSVIHRDLKAQNVLLTNNLDAKIMDFGLSKLVVDHDKTKTRRIGTPIYMAPEILGSTYDHRVDIFSFGILCYCLTSSNFTPYGQKSMTGIELKVANDEFFRPNISKEHDVSQWLRDVMSNSWKSKSKERPSFEKIVEIFEQNMKVEESLREIQKEKSDKEEISAMEMVEKLKRELKEKEERIRNLESKED